jgi:Na+-translocating ferredoxin:NAD+ oxidoreductase RnfE subunit
MRNKSIVFLFALCPLVPAASRFAYGLILAFAFIAYFLFGLLIRELVRKFNLGEASPYVELVCLAGIATGYYLSLQSFFPILAVSLGLYVFLSAFSYLLLVSVDYFSTKSRAFMPIIPFIPFILVFSLFRELLGSGSVSFPVASGLYEIPVLPYFDGIGLGFWGTSGGALILLGAFAWLLRFIGRRVSSLRRNA